MDELIIYLCLQDHCRRDCYMQLHRDRIDTQQHLLVDQLFPFMEIAIQIIMKDKHCHYFFKVYVYE